LEDETVLFYNIMREKGKIFIFLFDRWDQNRQ
jgi:hypothetical protein